MRERKGGNKYWRGIAFLLCAAAVLNLLGCFQGFCNWYKLTVYGWISDALGFLFGWIPVAVGELLGYAGAVAVLVWTMLLVLLLFLRKRAGFRRFVLGYGKGLLFAVLLLLLVYTLNWILPFRAAILRVPGGTERTYTLEEIQNVRNHIVFQLNACAKEVARDENGSVIYDHAQMSQATFAAMKAQAGEYPLLSGYYPPIKEALCSDFLEWMGIGGYTYPYTMEITWNKYCDDLYFPFLLAHEASHHQGYYQENEANFIAFLACTQSEDPLIRYAGYDEIYYYVNDAYLETVLNGMEPEAAVALIKQQPKVSEQVRMDRAEALEASQEKYDAASHPAQSLSTVSEQVADVGWSTQAELLQENSYDGVVKMVLEYYDVLTEGGLEHAF